MKEKNKSKKIKKAIIIIVLVVLLLILLIPTILLWPIIQEILFNSPKTPKIKHGEFDFELVYEYQGKENKIEDTIICDYEGKSFILDGGNKRDWNCIFKSLNEYGHYYIDEENIPDLYIVVPDAPDYYMGDKEATKEYAEPYIHYIDESTGTYYEEKDKIDAVDLEIIEWKPSKPLKDNFK